MPLMVLLMTRPGLFPLMLLLMIRPGLFHTLVSLHLMNMLIQTGRWRPWSLLMTRIHGTTGGPITALVHMLMHLGLFMFMPLMMPLVLSLVFARWLHLHLCKISNPELQIWTRCQVRSF